MSPEDRSYVAALVDVFGRLRARDVRGSRLPEVTIQGSRIDALDWLANITGVRVSVIGKDYTRHQCSEHCPDKHTRIAATTRRWQVTGARATILLHDIEPYMRVQGRQARALVQEGSVVGVKPPVVREMKRLGWSTDWLTDPPTVQ